MVRALQRALDNSVARVRDGFSTAVLGTTSPTLPGLAGGLPFAWRFLMALVSVVLGLVVAFASAPKAGPFATLFFFPALMLAAACGIELALLAYVVCLGAAILFFTSGTATIFFALSAALQVTIVLVLRQFFRESRRWGVRYRRLVTAIASATTVFKPDGRIERPHPEFSRLTGMKWPNYRDLGWIEAIHPEDRELLIPKEPAEKMGLHRAELRVRDASSGDWRWHNMRAVPLLDDEGEVEEWVSILSDIHERRLGQEEREIAVGELRHRLKNLMTIVNSLAKSSRPRDNKAVDDYLRKFLGRLNALTIAADQVIANEQTALAIGAVVRATLTPFVEENSPRVKLDGPYLLLSEQTGGALALGVHELATNAIKYGALSVADGKVEIRWRCFYRGDGEEIVIEWIETGGPKPEPPAQEGFGTRVIRFVPAREKNGKVDIEYRPEGVYCRIGFTRAAPLG